jgi:hypothetical protein
LTVDPRSRSIGDTKLTDSLDGKDAYDFAFNVQLAFENFFIEAGITTKDNGKFKWNDDYFPPITSQTNTSE